MAESANSNITPLVLTAVATAIVAGAGGYLIGANNAGFDPAASEVAVGSAALPSAGAPLGDSDVIPIGTSPTKGPADAAVTIVEFSDYQCPFCQRGANTLDELQKKYPNDVRIVFKNNPLPFHKQAPDASKAALAAGEQGKFWEMHDKLFENFKQFGANAADMKGYTAGFAQELGLDVEKFKRDFDKPEYQAAIDRDLALGKKLGVRGTPHFFINGVRLSGAQPLPKFEEVVKQQIDAAKAAGPNSYAALVKKNYQEAEAPKPQAPPASKVAYIPVKPEDAKMGPDSGYLITMVEFSDYQCPFCKRGDDVAKQVVKEYGDKVRFVYKHLPLPFHKEAEPAARAALAAGKQGKFWEYHALLFENQKEMKTNPDLWTDIAKKVGLNMAKFKKDMEDPAIAKQVKDDAALAASVGARGTPNFFINGVQLVGAQPFPTFKAEIDKQLKVAEEMAKKGTRDEALYKAMAEHNKKNAPAPAAKAQPNAPAPKVDTKLLTDENTYAKGPKNAPVTIYEFSDFQCPFCSRGASTIDQIVEKYGDKVRVVFKAYPLPFHKEAKPASIAALAAGRQGKFWEMHDLLFKNQQAMKTNPNLWTDLAKQLGLNMAKFEKDMADPALATQVDTEMAQGSKVGVRGTPAFFINGNRLVGAQPLPKFAELIDAELKK